MLVTKGDSTGTLASHQYDSGWLDDGIILGMVAGTGHPTNMDAAAVTLCQCRMLEQFSSLATIRLVVFPDL